MSNDTIHIDQISSQSNPRVDSQHDENTTQNDIKSKEIGYGIKEAKKIPMTPTRLEYSWWSTHPTEIAVIISILFIIMVITVGTMIVCLTQLLPEAKECKFVIKQTIRNYNINDSRPHSVAIDDFNNDGLPDIVVPNSGMSNIGVFLQGLNGTLSDQMTYSTGSGSTPYAVVVTDFNHDQQLDIAVANFGSHTIGIFLGIGNGTFKTQITFSTGSSRPRSIAVGDFNNDQEVDVVVINYATNDIGIFLQDTNGSFARQMSFSTGYDSDPYSLAAGDLNNDQKLDIVVANYGTNNVGVFLGYGNGSFAVQIIFSTGINSHPSSIAVGNLNNNTCMDIVVACFGTNHVAVLMGDGKGTFAMPIMYSTGNDSLPRSVVIADFDNDDKLDIAVANYGDGSVLVLLGDGNGYFSDQNQTFLARSNLNPHSIAVGDFNNDNRSDIAVVSYDFNYVDIILNYRNYSCHSQITYSTAINSHPTSIAIADLNNDNHRDIIVVNYGYQNVEIFFGDGNGTFSDRIDASFYSWGPYSVAVGDFNNDNQADLVIVFYLDFSIVVALGDGSGSFRRGSVFSTGMNSYPIALTIGDFNNDNQSDIVVADFGTNNINVFLGDGYGRFFTPLTSSTDSRPCSIAIGDFNNDSRLDIVVANSEANNVGVFLGYGNGTFADQITYSTDSDWGPSSVAVGDFNSDNRLDIIVASNGTDSIGLFFGYGDGTFSNQINIATGSHSHPSSISTGDFNNDNRLDVVVTNQRSGKLGVFVGFGNGSFSSQITYSTGSGSRPGSVAVGDLNNDGHLDIAVADSGTSNVGIFIGYGNGNFATQQIMTTTLSSNSVSVAVGDLNNDGRPDVVVANSAFDNLGIFLGDGNNTFSSQTTYDVGPGSGPWSVVIGDFNNDSRLDIVVVNQVAQNIGVLLGFGDGTFSNQTVFPTGDNSAPWAVAVGDFNSDDRLDVVVANSGTSNIGVFLGYGDGSFHSQLIYSTGSDSGPCSIAVGDLNNDTHLDIVVSNYNKASNVGVFLGYGNGTFFSQTTYSLQKRTKPLVIVVGDLNNDDRLDVVVVLNGYGGVVVFLGHGNGTLSGRPTYTIGSDSQPFACAVGDVNNDGQLDLVVTDSFNDIVVVLLGDGYGSFSHRRSYSTGTNANTVSIALADFNNDRILDIIVVNYFASTIGIFIGFTYLNGLNESIYSTGSTAHPRAIVLADFNKDTHLDIVMTNYGLNNVEVLSSDTNKTFSIHRMFSTGVLSLPTSVAVGDFNNDGEFDITVANSGTGNIGLLYGFESEDGFTSQTTFSPGFNFIPQSVAVGDFNNDKRMDIVVAASGTNSVTTLLRYDPGAFRNKTMYSTGTGSSPTSVAVGDLNKDGWLDFVIANSDGDNVDVFLGLGNGIFSSQMTYLTGGDSLPRCIAVADLNKDSHLDIILCNNVNGTIGIFFGFGNGAFSNQITYPTGQYSAPVAIAIDDFNNDKCLDIVVINYGSNNVGIFLGNNDDIFSSMTSYSTGSGSNPCSVVVGDFNNDNCSDFVVTNFNASNVGVFIGYGDGTFSVMSSYSTGNSSGPVSIVVGDFNSDGRLDLIVANSHTENIGVLFGFGDGTFSNQMTYPTGSGSQPYSVAIGDLNNDNQLDIAVANLGSNSFSVLLGCENGTFFSPVNYLIADGSLPFSIAVSDLNNDNRLDIIVVNTGTDNVGVFFGYIEESFLFASAYPTGALSRPTSIAVGDFDHDNRLDVVVANNGTDNIMILFGSGYGTFVSHTSCSTGNDSEPCGVAVGDFNNDSSLDIVVTNSGISNIGIFLNNGNGTFSSQMTYSTGLDSQPYSIAVLDFDNDTRLDIAVANYGSNNVVVFFGDGHGSFAITNQSIYYTGFDSHPYGIAVGDMNNDNQCDIVVTNNGYGNVNIILKEC